MAWTETWSGLKVRLVGGHASSPSVRQAYEFPVASTSTSRHDRSSRAHVPSRMVPASIARIRSSVRQGWHCSQLVPGSLGVGRMRCWLWAVRCSVA
jgi:hypothetical protein